MCHVLIQMFNGTCDFAKGWKPLLQVGSAIGNLSHFDFRRHCGEMATEVIVSKFQCYRNCVVEYNAKDGGFQCESQN